MKQYKSILSQIRNNDGTIRYLVQINVIRSKSVKALLDC